ncbi:MAG TPA: TMEM175 family protein [Dokdonella sp.]|nr:TMEM175 family protein [Dokdonella sp.]
MTQSLRRDPGNAARDEDGFPNRGAEVTRAEAFFDAAFAFAITLMVISIDAIPDTAEKLVDALKSVPAFAASFMLIVLFWRGHADWSRRFGMNDRYSQRLSLLLVFIVLVFIYPLRMVFSSFFPFVTGGWLPAQIHLETVSDVRAMFIVFAVGFGSMGASMCLLYRHAWSRRDDLGLDAVERLQTRYAALRWALIPVVSVLSLGISVFLLREGTTSNLLMAMPGLIFFALNIAHVLLGRRLRRARMALQST